MSTAATDALDRVKDLAFDWGQDFVDDETMAMHSVLEDLWNAIAGMPEGAKVDEIPTRAPGLCPHLWSTQPAFAVQWNRLWAELTDLRLARMRLVATLDLAEHLATALGGIPIVSIDDVREAAGIEVNR